MSKLTSAEVRGRVIVVGSGEGKNKERAFQKDLYEKIGRHMHRSVWWKKEVFKLDGWRGRPRVEAF